MGGRQLGVGPGDQLDGVAAAGERVAELEGELEQAAARGELDDDYLQRPHDGWKLLAVEVAGGAPRGGLPPFGLPAGRGQLPTICRSVHGMWGMFHQSHGTPSAGYGSVGPVGPWKANPMGDPPVSLQNAP
jgi:hypothetical protein